MENPILRQLGASDVASVSKLELLCNPMPWNSEALSRFVSLSNTDPSGANSIGEIAVLENTGEVVGYICAGMVGDEAEILVMGVDPQHRRLGIGQSLLLELGDVLRTRACKNLFLEVRSGNGAARSLYRKAGFVEAGIRRGYYADTGENAMLLRWDLSR